MKENIIFQEALHHQAASLLSRFLAAPPPIIYPPPLLPIFLIANVSVLLPKWLLLDNVGVVL